MKQPFQLTRALALSAILAGVLLVLTLLDTHAQEPPPFNIDEVTVPDEPPLAVLGEPIYQQNCAACHGPEGMSDGPSSQELPSPPPRFAAPETAWNSSPAQWFHTTKYGRIENFMPPWQNQLSDREIWQAVYYAWGLHTSQEQIATGDRLYEQSCTRCHGPRGAGDGSEAAGAMPDFTDLSTMMAVSQADLLNGWQDAHPEFGAEWSDEQQAAVLEYIRTFTYRPASSFSIRSGSGVITGEVVQQTPQGEDFSGAVTLQVFAGNRPLASLEQPAGQEDSFRFEELPTEPGLVYLVSAEHAGVTYSSTPVSFSDSSQSGTGSSGETGSSEEEEGAENVEITVDVPIYETTTRDDDVYVSRANWIVELAPGALLIGQLYLYGNRGDTTFVGQEMEGIDSPVTVAIPIPAEAESVDMQDGAIGEAYRRMGDRIYDTRPIRPGEFSRQVFVRYRLPYDGQTYSFEQPLVYPVSEMNFLVADLPDLNVDVELMQGTLSSAGMQEIEGSNYRQWTASSLPPQTAHLRFSGLLAPGDTDPRAGQAPATAGGAVPATVQALEPITSILLGGALALILLGTLVWTMWVRRNQMDSTRYVSKQRQDLVRRIARLDDYHALGELDEPQWQSRRAALKRELLSLVSGHEDDGPKPEEPADG